MIEAARRLIEGAGRVVSFSGAGLSAESGIGTFRDAGGLWANFDPAKLASPQGFAENPQLVIDWYAERRRAIAAARPNAAHEALAARGDYVHVTQNIDDLLLRAGAERVVRLHGTIAWDRCHAACGHREQVDLAEPPPLRDCPGCGAPMRPDVVWFGEMLPAGEWRAAEQACRACDVLLVIGTSAVVYPAAGLIDVARAGGAKVVIVNTERTDAGAAADVELIGPAGELVPQLIE